MNNANRILSAKNIAALLGVHISTLYRWESQGRFVPKVRLGPGRVGYMETDVNAWLNERRKAA